MITFVLACRSSLVSGILSTVRFIVTMPLLRSMSSQRIPHSSPMRTPLNRANRMPRYKGSCVCSRRPSIARHVATSSVSIGFFRCGGRCIAFISIFQRLFSLPYLPIIAKTQRMSERVFGARGFPLQPPSVSRAFSRHAFHSYLFDCSVDCVCGMHRFN